MPGRALPGFFISAMSVIISGSVAYDTVFTHEGRFADAIRPDALDCLNLTFQACGMRRTFGGCAGNIAWSLKQLGGDPLIWSAMGRDAGPFLEHFRRSGIRTDGITVMPDEWSAQCVITTDAAGNQLTTFHSGAMAHAHAVPWPDDPGIEFGILAPSCREPLMRHADAYDAHGVPFIFDPGQTTPLYTGEELLSLALRARAVAFSDYEGALIEARTGFDAGALSLRGPVVFCTHGSRGSTVWENGVGTTVATPAAAAVDPVGAGDAYRGGLLWGMTHGLRAVDCARLGSLMGRAKVLAAGPAYSLPLDEARRQFETLWGKAPF